MSEVVNDWTMILRMLGNHVHIIVSCILVQGTIIKSHNATLFLTGGIGYRIKIICIKLSHYVTDTHDWSSVLSGGGGAVSVSAAPAAGGASAAAEAAPKEEEKKVCLTFCGLSV